jgi:SpoVK/Ycf46/Vps4 family AAA+-type ATPase
MNTFTNFVTLVIVNLLPIDTNARMAIGLALGQLLDKTIEYITKNGIINRIWFIRRWFGYNTVRFSSENYQFYNLIDYYYKRYNHIITDANILHARGGRHLVIESLSHHSMIDTFEGERYYTQIRKTGEIKVDDIPNPTYELVFSSNQSTEKINSYIENLMKITSKSVDHEFSLYSINVEKSKEHRKISWEQGRSISNKTIKNVIVSEKIKRDFYDDLESFWKKEDEYNRCGITFKRGYLIHGLPGSGKSSLISSIINEYNLPVFKLDMSIIKENDELARLNNTIYDYIGMSERHLVLMEDIDRCKLFDYNKYSELTMDAILNMLDGVNGTHGRITIMTANNISQIKVIQGLLRPGRIDRIIELSYCSNIQIKKILALNFNRDDNFELNDVNITPASLNKLIQILQNFDMVIDYLNKHPNINEDDLENIREPDKQTYDVNQINIIHRVRRYKKSNKPRGLPTIEKLEKQINRDEVDLEFAEDKGSLDYRIRELRLAKLKLQLEKKKKIYNTPVDMDI